jgi:hypothetical protein
VSIFVVKRLVDAATGRISSQVRSADDAAWSSEGGTQRLLTVTEGKTIAKGNDAK